MDAGDTANTEISIYDYGDKCIVFETRGWSIDNSKDEVLNRLFRATKGNKMGEVFYGTKGYVVELTETKFVAYDKDFNVLKEFEGGGSHFANFVNAAVSRDSKQLNADVNEGHLSAAISHLGNIAYQVGEYEKVSVSDLQSTLKNIKSLDDNLATLDRTIQHLTDNGVDLKTLPLTMSPVLKFDPKRELFTDSPESNAMLTRDYRKGFVCPTAYQVYSDHPKRLIPIQTDNHLLSEPATITIQGNPGPASPGPVRLSGILQTGESMNTKLQTVLSLALVCASVALSYAQESKPNVLFIVCDDLNTHVSTSGYPHITTPALDHLAEEGMTFRRAY